MEPKASHMIHRCSDAVCSAFLSLLRNGLTMLCYLALNSVAQASLELGVLLLSFLSIWDCRDVLPHPLSLFICAKEKKKKDRFGGQLSLRSTTALHLQTYSLCPYVKGTGKATAETMATLH